MQKKKAIVFICILLSVVMILSISGCSKSESTGGETSNDNIESVTLKLGHVNNEAYPYTDGAEKFKALVEEKTEGNVKVDIYSSGQLGNETDLIEQTQEGTIDFCITATAPISNFLDSFKIFDLPFLFKDSKHMFEVLDSDIGQSLMEDTQEIGITALGFWSNGVRSPGNSKREVNNLSDMKDLKIRVMENPIHIASYDALGAVPTPMAWGEVFTGLQQGAIDGFESSPVTFSTDKYYEVTKYYAYINMLFSPGLFMANTSNLENLSQEYQTIILDAAKEATLHERAVYEKKVEASIEDMEANGMTVIEPDKGEFIEAVEVVYEKFGDDIGWDLINLIRDK